MHYVSWNNASPANQNILQVELEIWFTHVTLKILFRQQNKFSQKPGLDFLITHVKYF